MAAPWSSCWAGTTPSSPRSPTRLSIRLATSPTSRRGRCTRPKRSSSAGGRSEQRRGSAREGRRTAAGRGAPRPLAASSSAARGCSSKASRRRCSSGRCSSGREDRPTACGRERHRQDRSRHDPQAHINGSIGTVVSRASGSADGRVDLALGPPHSKSISIRCQHLRPSRSEARGGMPTIAAPGGGGDGSALWVISPAERAAGEGRAAEAPSNPPRRVAVSCISVLPQPEHEGSA
mmetsp:Transcript_36054/g.107909  ORF Transcript_36054/g.107909 Transcript_36054/m.107909 type:complete len:235 (+) Transcript_36054:1211-1915(+)